MSGTFPSDPSPINVDVDSTTPTTVSTAENGKRQARNSGGHLWEISVDFPKMVKDEFEPISAFIMSQDGSHESFEYVPPDTAVPRGVATGAPLVAINATADSSSVTVKGFTASIINIMMQGDVIRFASHSKVYKVVANADSSVAGWALLSIKPNLIQSVAIDDAITVNGVPFTVYVSDVHKYRAEPAKFFNYKVKLMESIT